MANSPRVKLIATGGTIATTVDSSGHSAPRLSASDLIALAQGLGVDIEAESMRAQPSWALDPGAMVAIAERARDAARQPGWSGVVITHGTTTLEYTAFLSDALLDVATPVVLTGAMRRADDPEADGPANLRDAITVAASDVARDRGALVVFHRRVLAASRVWKARRTDDDAFLDTVGDVGRVKGGQVEMNGSSDRYGPFRGALDTDVAFIKVVPGVGATLLRSLPETTSGLVVEALPGAGGIPPYMQRDLIALAGRLPVVIAPRAPSGRVPRKPSGGTGAPLAGAPFLSCGPLTAEHAWLLLMLVLGETRDRETTRARFEHELFGRYEAKLPAMAEKANNRYGG
jgi:L-asparaginase